MKKTLFIGAVAFAAPMFASAVTGPDFGYFASILGNIAALLDLTIPVLIGIALIFFFWGLIQYIRNPGGGEGHGGTDGKKIMIAGLVGLFIMVSVWGIIRLGQQVFRVEDVPAPSAPRTPDF